MVLLADGGSSLFAQTVPSLPSTTLPAPLVPPLSETPALTPIPETYFRTPPPPRSIADRLFGTASNRTLRPLAPLALSAPNMFGDMTDGGCGEASFFAGIVQAGLEHPTFNCTRANLAENNSPLPRSRVYARYNHFHNINQISIFPETFPDGVNQLNIDRFTFGAEVAFLNDRVSLEARLPVARQLTSDVVIYDNQGNYNLPLDDYRTEILNLQFILKALLIEREEFALSSGVGLNVPTAQDFNINIDVADDEFEIVIPGIGQIGTVPVYGDVTGQVKNSIFNLSPFVAYLWTPTPRFFSQGFFQLDVPLNTAQGSVSATIGQPGPNQIVFPRMETNLRQQTLLRINLGTGYWVWTRPERSFLQGVAGILELNYTTALNNADMVPFSIPVLPLPDPLPDLKADIVVGNLANRVDILNLTSGVHVQLWPRTTLGVGFVVPVRQQAGDKPFDFELNVLLNHML